MRQTRYLQVALWVLIIILFSVAARAGELGVWACPAVEPDVTHFNVYADGALLVSVPVGDLITQTTILVDCDSDGSDDDQRVGVEFTAPDGCQVRGYTARWAVPGDESVDSILVSAMARPKVLDALVNDPTGIDELYGHNFAPGVQVRLLDGTPIPVLSFDCETIDIENTETRTVVVDTGLKPHVFNLPVGEPHHFEVR